MNKVSQITRAVPRNFTLIKARLKTRKRRPVDYITHATRIVKAMQFAYFIIFMIDKEITMLVVLARALALRYILRCLGVDNQIPIKSAIILSEMLKKCMKINYDL